MITLADSTLWGMAGGQLEYVSQRIEWKQRPNESKWEPYVIIRFTDHDMCAFKNEKLIEGKYYELEFPLASDP